MGALLAIVSCVPAGVAHAVTGPLFASTTTTLHTGATTTLDTNTTTTTTPLPPGPCGDGVRNAGEECDDGNTQSGDCCSSACAYEPAGSACGAPGPALCDQAFQHGCNGAGQCFTSLDQNCWYPVRSARGNLRDPDAPRADDISLRCENTEYYMTLDQVGDPSADTAYAFCIFTAFSFGGDYQLAYELALPTGSGWTPIPGGWTYRAASRADPIRRASIHAEDGSSVFPALRTRLRLHAHGASLSLPGPATSTHYFDVPDNGAISMCLVNDRGLRTGFGSFSRWMRNTPKHVHLGPIRSD